MHHTLMQTLTPVETAHQKEYPTPVQQDKKLLSDKLIVMQEG